MKQSLALVTLLSLLLGTALGQQEPAKKKKASEPKGPSPLAQIEDVPGLPRVLILGDSISIGYTLAVRDLLKGKANVHRPRANCGPTTAGLKSLDEWLASGGAGKKWDVIHFNWGLHDLKYMGPNGENLTDPAAPGSHQQVPPAEYEKNLRALVARLQQTGAKLIWRNTTPVPPGVKGRVPGDEVTYNAIAAKIMAEHDIPTDDLYTFAQSRLAEIQLPANVHFSDEGSKVLATQVVAAIEKALPQP
ncbi:MAG: SGNH/GDSL hydrolase family protein [Verrucomicrobiales bacterium]|nr:SGNH/GDSL hydrolase family protein [Verrucomicrobiales bacterium]